VVFRLDENGDPRPATLPVEGYFVHLADYGTTNCSYRGIHFDTLEDSPTKTPYTWSIHVPLDRIGLNFLIEVLKQHPDIEDNQAVHHLYDLILATLAGVADDHNEIKGEFWYA